MNEVGVINEIARGESIYAARFVGKYVYFITYRQTDPLFVADISNPTAPKLLGELEVMDSLSICICGMIRTYLE